MALDMGTAVANLSSIERTTQIVVSTPYKSDPSITITRELLRVSNGSIVSRDSAGVVIRQYSNTANQVFTVNGKSYTTAEIASVLTFVADTWRKEDTKSTANTI